MRPKPVRKDDDRQVRKAGVEVRVCLLQRPDGPVFGLVEANDVKPTSRQVVEETEPRDAAEALPQQVIVLPDSCETPPGYSAASGCGTATTDSPSMPRKSSGLHVNRGKSFARATAAIIAS